MTPLLTAVEALGVVIAARDNEIAHLRAALEDRQQGEVGELTSQLAATTAQRDALQAEYDAYRREHTRNATEVSS